MASRKAPTALEFYRTVWRWHFYAGLFVAPFLIILAVTGSIYLFNQEIDDALHADRRFVQPYESALPPDRLIEAAVRSVEPGSRAIRIDMPPPGTRTATVFLAMPDGEERRVALNPATGDVLGSYVYSRTLVGFADLMHGSLFLGTLGDRLVELAACWAIVLVGTGLFLWWPRGADRKNHAFTPDFRARGRPFWRSLHKTAGLYGALMILFLVFTGLPWAGVWGELLKTGTNAVGIGYPAAAHQQHEDDHSAHVKDEVADVPWALENAPMPHSHVMTGHDHDHGLSQDLQSGQDGLPSIGAGRAAIIAAEHGIEADYRMTLPSGDTGVFTVLTYPDRPQGQHTLQIDRYSGKVLRDFSFADYGWAAQAVEMGVQLHMGNYFGRANQLVMLATCMLVITLITTGCIMWLKRRPSGRLGAPAPVHGVSLRKFYLFLAVLGLLFPLVGVSFIVAFILDRVFAPLRAMRTAS